jgi:hypothetical protein
VFNGDVHWLDVDPRDFQAISDTVLAHHAIKGNVEAELQHLPRDLEVLAFEAGCEFSR